MSLNIQTPYYCIVLQSEDAYNASCSCVSFCNIVESWKFLLVQYIKLQRLLLSIFNRLAIESFRFMVRYMGSLYYLLSNIKTHKSICLTLRYFGIGKYDIYVSCLLISRECVHLVSKEEIYNPLVLLHFLKLFSVSLYDF